MILNCIKLWRAVTVMNFLARVISLIFLPKTLIWNKITFPASKSLNFARLVENELMKGILKKLPVFFFLSKVLLFIVNILRAYNQSLNFRVERG